MRLYYTVSSGTEAVQSKPSLSLGGYKSSNPLVNSQIGNLFSDITTLTVQQFNQNQFIGLILKNETGAAVTGIQMWFEYPDGCYSDFTVAAVDLSTDENGNKVMEQIPTINSQPLYGEFYEANGPGNAVDIGDLGIDEQVGIWIQRSLLTDVILAQQANVAEKVPNTYGYNYDSYQPVILPILDEINLGISWS